MNFVNNLEKWDVIRTTLKAHEGHYWDYIYLGVDPEREPPYNIKLSLIERCVDLHGSVMHPGPLTIEKFVYEMMIIHVEELWFHQRTIQVKYNIKD
jgi:hypothetical protein